MREARYSLRGLVFGDENCQVPYYEFRHGDLIMLKKPENLAEGHVACEVCLKEIPHSVSHSHEGPDYVLYFCGDDCFVKWQQGESLPGQPKAPTGK
jgi:hypothetical protein